MNKLIVTEEYLDFSDFDGINKTITICLFPGKLVILNKYYKNTFEEHPITLDDNFRLWNKDYVKIFQERNIVTGTSFIKMFNAFYQD